MNAFLWSLLFFYFLLSSSFFYLWVCLLVYVTIAWYDIFFSFTSDDNSLLLIILHLKSCGWGLWVCTAMYLQRPTDLKFLSNRKKFASLKTGSVLDLCWINESRGQSAIRCEMGLVTLVQLENSNLKSIRIWKWNLQDGNKSHFYLKGECNSWFCRNADYNWKMVHVNKH